MKSFKNHLSLVVALLSILFSIQIFIIVDRSIEAYKENLSNNYAVIIVSQKKLSDEAIFDINDMISNVSELSAESVIKRLNSGINKKNIELLKLTLPKFYKLGLAYYPSPKEIKRLRKDLLKNSSIKKVEDFSHNHDTTYKLLLLFKNVVLIFAVVVLIVTILLIFKELRIWQFKHSERMSIMGLFGAPVWLRSAVLFRLAIVDAIIASVIAFSIFMYISTSLWVQEQFNNIGINVVIYDLINDSALLFGAAMGLSILLASLIVLGHKEEV
ncbi:cell division protein FtsX [Sulfurimonas sp.]|uniref:cell division protein FtsX n=1 Tax=Sulfurimonas sp. TaxID=2022749 RepID=UPI0035641BDB